MTKQENQCFRVHTYLKEHKVITGYSAFSEIGVYRLSSCIHRLRKRGIDIPENIYEIEEMELALLKLLSKGGRA